MAAAASQTRTVNRALTLLGQSTRIQSIADGTPAAAAAAAVWEDAVAATLAGHPWNFAIARAALAADVAAPEFGYAFAYPLPADCLRWLPPAPGDDDWFRGEREGARILADAPGPLRIRYVARVADPVRWSVGFADALAARLAMELVEPITGGLEGLASRMEQRYAAALDAAKLQDALESGDRAGRVEDNSTWNAARHGLALAGERRGWRR